MDFSSLDSGGQQRPRLVAGTGGDPLRASLPVCHVAPPADRRGVVADRGDAVHDRIALVRADRGASRRDLAEAKSMRHRTGGHLDRGAYAPSLALLRLSAFFDVPGEALFSQHSLEGWGRLLSVSGDLSCP